MVEDAPLPSPPMILKLDRKVLWNLLVVVQPARGGKAKDRARLGSLLDVVDDDEEERRRKRPRFLRPRRKLKLPANAKEWNHKEGLLLLRRR